MTGGLWLQLVVASVLAAFAFGALVMNRSLRVRQVGRWSPSRRAFRASLRMSSPAISFTHNDLPSETLYVLDGTAMLFHAYFSRESKSSELADAFFHPSAADAMTQRLSAAGKLRDLTGNGAMSSAALTVAALRFARFVRDVRPTYVAMAFDVSRKSLFRAELLPEYKQHRQETPLDLQLQLLLAPSVFSALGCQCFAQEGYEADDLMASLGRWARGRGLSVALLASDKDLLQLVDTGVHILNPQSFAITGPDDVRQKFGVLPRQVPDLFALTGDAADNVRGAEGIGGKTAAALLTRFGDIDGLFRALRLDGRPPLDERLVARLRQDDAKTGKAKAALMAELLREHYAQSTGAEASAAAQLDAALAAIAALPIRISAPKVLWALAELGEERARLFRSVVTLHTDLDWSAARLVAAPPGADDASSPLLPPMANAAPRPLDELSSALFRFEGEAASAPNLEELSPSLRRPVQLLRQQYHRLGR